jgi:hypothetical protein
MFRIRNLTTIERIFAETEVWDLWSCGDRESIKVVNEYVETFWREDQAKGMFLERKKIIVKLPEKTWAETRKPTWLTSGTKGNGK